MFSFWVGELQEVFLDSQNHIVVLRFSFFLFLFLPRELKKCSSTRKISSSYSAFLAFRTSCRATRANRRAAGTPLLVRRSLYDNAAIVKVEERALVRRVAKGATSAHGDHRHTSGPVFD